MNVPTTDDQHLWVSWDDYHRLIERLALQIHESGWKFDFILCLARGGLRVGDQLSRIYDLPLAILATSSYREAAGTRQGTLDIARYITMTRGDLSGNVLLVDDLVDSGVTLARVQQHLAERFPAISAVRSAVLWYKGCSVTRPDYHVEHLPLNPWIHQPFEEWDAVRPHNLASWIKRGRSGERSGGVASENDAASRVPAAGSPAASPAPNTGASPAPAFAPAPPVNDAASPTAS